MRGTHRFPTHRSGRLPTNEEVDAILGGEPHEYGRGHDSWMPSYRIDEDGNKEKDWIQTGDPNRYCQSHLRHHKHYPGWGEETHHMEHKVGWDWRPGMRTTRNEAADIVCSSLFPLPYPFLPHKGWMMIAVFNAMPRSCSLAVEALKQRASELIDKVENKDIWDAIGKYESDLSRAEKLLEDCDGSSGSVGRVVKE